MSPTLTFFFGLLLLVLFGWYFATDAAKRKRALGTVLIVLLTAFCLEQALPPEKKIRLGLDLQGGTSFLLRLVKEEGRDVTPDQQEKAVEVIRKRVDAYGLTEPAIMPVGQDRITVELPGLSGPDVEAMQASLQQVAKLDFALVHPQNEVLVAQIEAGNAIVPPSYELKYMKEEREGKEVLTPILVKQRPDLSGKHVTRAFAYFDQRGYGISMDMDSEGAKLFADLTAANVGRRLAILLDGEVQSAPSITEPIYTGRATITGRFTEKEARDLASVLENPLSNPVLIEETRSISAKLGMDSIRSGIFAGLVGVGLVLLTMLIYYRLAGVIAILGLVVNIIILFGVMAMFKFTLTLPGIAGIILTVGMAVDANVLIYERLREELAAGKSLKAAIEASYEKAFSAIFDANITTLITSVILFWQATGPVRGFAVTLTVGLIASMFSALLATRTAFSWMTDLGGLSKLSMMNLIPARQINFLRFGRPALIFSLILTLGSIAIVLWRGEANLGIDFRGGDLLAIEYKQPVTVQEVREAVTPLGLADATIQKEGDVDAERITIQTPAGVAEEALVAIKQALPDRGIEMALKEAVGAQIGGEFSRKALIAFGLGMLGILIYVSARFEFGFAVAAVVAVLHDVIITLGVFCLLGRELSLVMVGAFLTIAGYSINDTIVIFDRIREGLKSGVKGSIQELMNRSINETLGRTILTGGTTLIAVCMLLFLGGATLNNFALAIVIGILVGTYSSILVASPIVLWWYKLTGRNIRRVVLDSDVQKPASA